MGSGFGEFGVITENGINRTLTPLAQPVIIETKCPEAKIGTQFQQMLPAGRITGEIPGPTGGIHLQLAADPLEHGTINRTAGRQILAWKPEQTIACEFFPFP